MRIIIPTKGRISRQTTLENLPKALHEQVTIVCPPKEAVFHRNNFPACEVSEQPDPEMGIAAKRHWIIETAQSEKLVMLDDDLRFAVRRQDDPARFRKAEGEDIIRAFVELDAVLSEEVPHAGFSARGGGISEKAQAGGWQLGKRMMYVLGYHVPTLRKHAEFGRIGTHEDMDVCLQLLTKGFPNSVNFSFVVDQAFGNPGGCTNERTVEKNNTDVMKLASFFPAYVRVTQKDYAGSVPRMEVVVQWKRAMEDGLRNRQ